MDLPPLLGRQGERAAVEDALVRAERGEPQLVVVTGRRRIGKTFLLSHVAAGHRSVFFAATQQSERVELDRFAAALRRSLGEDVLELAGGSLASWEAALRLVSALGRAQPLTVVLDEVGYLLRSTPGLASVLQAWWDHLPRPSQVSLVLTGSAVSTVEQLLGAGAPLLGRPTHVLRMRPVPLADAPAFLPGADAETVVHAYAAGGGYPLHLTAWDPGAPVEENLVRLAGTAGGLLLEDAPGIVREEVPDAPGYTRILAAVAAGRTRTGQIADLAGQRVEHPLGVLLDAGLLRREVPLGAPAAVSLGGRARWAVDDPYLRWYYRVLLPARGLVEGGQGRAVLRRAAGAWADQLGAVFEEGARQHAARLVEEGALPPCVLGRWWAERGEPTEVDVLGLDGAAHRRAGRGALDRPAPRSPCPRRAAGPPPPRAAARRPRAAPLRPRRRGPAPDA